MDGLQFTGAVESQEMRNFVPSTEPAPVSFATATIDHRGILGASVGRPLTTTNQCSKRLVVKERRQARKHHVAGFNVPPDNRVQFALVVELLELKVEPPANEPLQFLDRADVPGLACPAFHQPPAERQDRFRHPVPIGYGKPAGNLYHSKIAIENSHFT